VVGVAFSTNASNASSFRPYPVMTSINPAVNTATVNFVHTQAALGTFTVTARAICASP
jgi:hypothetical protein